MADERVEPTEDDLYRACDLIQDEGMYALADALREAVRLRATVIQWANHRPATSVFTYRTRPDGSISLPSSDNFY